MDTTQSTAPKIQFTMYFLYVMLPTPATKGAKVLTMGTNLASMIVFAPCFS